MPTAEQSAAHRIVYVAIRGGKLVRQPCEVCGGLKSQAHHPDYSKPLQVIWLCATHHKDIHFCGAIRGNWRQWTAEFAMSPHLPIACPYWEPAEERLGFVKPQPRNKETAYDLF